MKKTIIALLLFAVVKMSSQPALSWAKSMTSSGTGKGNCTVVDATGNVYTTGTFSDNSTDFDPGPGTFNLNGFGGNEVFVLKLNSAGGFVWAKIMSGPLNDEALGLAVDASSNVYVAGYFSGTTDFDPGAATYTLNSPTSSPFVCKLNASGAFVWAKNFGGTGSGIANSISLDPSGNVYTTGNYTGTVDFDPSPSTYTLASNGTSTDIFISKLDNSGSFVWAKSIGDVSSEEGCSIAIDASSNVYLTGGYHLTPDFDPGPGIYTMTAVNAEDMYVLKLDAAGNFVFAKSMGGTSTDVGYSIVVDGSGNIFTTGRFNQVADFDPGPGVFNLISNGVDDIFVCKLDNTGALAWAKGFGSSQWDWGCSIALDNLGNVYTTGLFYNTVDFDPGPGTFNLTANGSNTDIFISKLDANGSFVWAGELTGPLSDQGLSITLDASMNIYSTGFFMGTVDFNPGPAQYTINALGSNIYCHKLCQPPNLPGTITGNTTVCSGSSNLYSISIVPNATGYNWSYPAGWTGGNLTNTVNATPIGASGNISVTANNSCGSSSVQTLSIVVNANPTITASGGGICLGQSYTIVPGGASSYTYSGGSAIVSPTANTSYSVTGTSSLGCTSASPAVITVSILSLPTITVNSGTVCLGNSFTIVPSGANTYTFSGGSAIVSPTTNTSYSVTGTGTNGCVSSGPAVSNVTVLAIPLPTITVNSGAICNGQSFTIVPSGANTYTISGGPNIVSPTNNSSYTVTGTNSLGCISNSFAISSVTVHQLPNINVVSTNSVICTGESATLTATGATTYSWSQGSNSQTVVVSPSVNTNYTISGTDVNGCQNYTVFAEQVDACTGIRQLVAIDNDIKAYPNPVNTELFIEFNNEGEKSIILYDDKGMLIYEEKTTNTIQKINFERLAKGIYLLRVQQWGRELKNMRIIKE